MSPSLAERLSKRVVIASLAVAIPVHLLVDPVAGWTVRVATAIAFIASLLAARRWPASTPAVAMAVLPLGPALLTALLHVAALNIFYTLLLTALFGALLPRLRLDRWALPGWWALLLGTWGLTLALGWPVMIVREAGLRLGTLRDNGALDTWALLTTPQVESFILYVTIFQLVALLWFDWLLANRERGDPQSPALIPAPVHGLWIGATLASLVAIYQGTVNMAFLSGGIWPGLRRAAGTLLDANGYGTVAAFAGVIAFVSIPHLGWRHTRAAQAAALALNWAGAWMSGSRTAFVCGAIGTVALVYEMLRAKSRVDGDTRETSSLFAGIAVVVMLLIAAAGAIGPVRRIVSPVTADARLTELWSRGGYGTVALRMIRDYPLTGVGIGSFNWMAADYWREMVDQQLPVDNAQNWWRHQVVELGIVGALPVVAWSFLIAWLVLTRRTPQRDRIEASALRGLLIALGIMSLVGMPVQNSIVLLIFFYLVARFDSLTRHVGPDGPPVREARGRQQALWIAAFVLAIGYAGAQFVLARGPLKPLARAERTNRDYVIGAYPGEALEIGSFRWTRKRATFAVDAPSRHLLLRFHVEHPDLGTHPVKVRVETPCQTLVDEFLTDAAVDERSYELPEGQSRLVFDTEVSRTWRPSDFGKADRRELGLAVETHFLNPAEAASRERWIPLKECEPV